jgi:hypothetical protein
MTVIKLAKAVNKAAPKPESTWKRSARVNHARSIADFAAGKLSPLRVADAGLGLSRSPVPSYRQVPLIVDAAELEDLGPRTVAHPGRRGVTRRWFRDRNGTAFEVLGEVPVQALDDQQRTDMILVKVSEMTAETIEETAKGRRVAPQHVVYRHLRARVWAKGTWSLAD